MALWAGRVQFNLQALGFVGGTGVHPGSRKVFTAGPRDADSEQEEHKQTRAKI